MPSYGGASIFGFSYSFATNKNPTAAQVNAFFGLEGMESLYGGSRGYVTLVRGLLFGSNASALGAAEEAFRSYDDGIARDLVDNFGVTWPQVKMVNFSPQGRVIRDGRGFYRPYQAQFQHLL